MNVDEAFSNLSRRLDALTAQARPQAAALFQLIGALAAATPVDAREGVARRIVDALRHEMDVDCRPDQAAVCADLLDWALPGLDRALVEALAPAYAAGRHPGLAQALAALADKRPDLTAWLAEQVECHGVIPLMVEGRLHLPCAVGGPLLVAGGRLFVDIATTAATVTVSEPRRLRLGLERRRAWLRDRFDCAYGVLIAPDKQSIHSGGLNAQDMAYSARVEALVDNIRAAGVATCHPLAPLRAGCERQDPFYRTDSHWNDFGAYTAYGALLETLAPQIALPRVEESRFTWANRPLFTDLGMSMLPEIRETTCYARFDDGAVRVAAKSALPSARYGWQVYENRDQSLPVAVVFRDSFFTALIPFMARTVSKLVCVGVDAGEMLVDLIEEVRPQLVLSASVERFALGMRAADLFRDEVPWKDGAVGPAMGGLDIPHYGSAVDDGPQGHAVDGGSSIR